MATVQDVETAVAEYQWSREAGKAGDAIAELLRSDDLALEVRLPARVVDC